MNPLLAAALDYAKRGWRVIALHHMTMYNGASVCSCGRHGECKAAAKHPVFSKWREVATTDGARLRSWWNAWPRANVGVLMGGTTGTICIDVDGEKGRTSLQKLEAENGPLPETLTQSTGRVGGGEHRLFAIDPFYADWVKNRAAIAPGIDIRSEGGLIVATPSLHPSGARYQWVTQAPIAPLPEWAFKLAISERERQKTFAANTARFSEAVLDAWGWTLDRRLAKARRVLMDAPPAIQGNGGSTICLRAVIAIVRGYCVPIEPTNHAFDLLWQVYNPRCEPPWADWELLHKIKTAELDVGVPWGYRLDSDPDIYAGAARWDGIKISLAPSPLLAAAIVARPQAHERRRQAPRLPKTAFELAASPEPVVINVSTSKSASSMDDDTSDVEECA